MNINPKGKEELRAILKRARETHKAIYGEELSIGELNHFFSSVLEYKRRKFIEGALGDHLPEEIITFLQLVDEEQGQGNGPEGNEQ